MKTRSPGYGLNHKQVVDFINLLISSSLPISYSVSSYERGWNDACSYYARYLLKKLSYLESL